MQKILLLILLAFLTLACTSKRDSALQEPSEISIVKDVADSSGLKETLRQQKAVTDSLFELELKDTILTQKRQQFQVWVKLPGKDGLIQILNSAWPEEVETTFNLLLDAKGKIIRISEMPYSESGDWSMMFNHYFTAGGKTFAFEKQVSAFNTFCPNDEFLEDLISEKALQLYSASFTLVDSTYQMTDEKDRDITYKKCELQVDSEAKVFKNLTTYLSANKLKFK